MPINIFDRQFFGDLQQFDTTTAFVRSIIEPTISILDSVARILIQSANIRFVTRIKQSLSFTTRIKDVEDHTI